MQLQCRQLGNLLVETGKLMPQQLEQAYAEQKIQGGRLEKILITLNFLCEDDILDVLEKQLGFLRVNFDEVAIHADAVETIPLTAAKRYQVMPVKKEGRRLTLAMTDPTDFFALDDIRLLSGMEIIPVLATEKDIREVICRYYGDEKHTRQSSVEQGNAETVENFPAQQGNAEEPPIISLVDTLIHQAIKAGASDIHVEPMDDLLRVRYRIDGVLREVATFPKRMNAPILSRIKIMSELNIAERRMPQDGRINMNASGHGVDIRVSTLPTIRGEKAVMRILDKRTVAFNIKNLGVSEKNRPLFKQLYAYSYGLVLVTGPTGSGKSTTLYSILSELNSADKNIITVEDPVEYRINGINQVQVNNKSGLNFSNGLRSILRQDPNIIMVGEMRDRETANLGVRAALTGHLVFSTLHTNDAAGAVTRLIDMGVESFLVASAVLGVVAQRLVRTICPKCKTPYPLAAEASERVFMGKNPTEPVTLYRGKGCSYCGFTGYRGRSAIHEVILMNPELRAAVTQKASTDELVKIARRNGLVSMKDDGVHKALTGETTIDEVIRVAYGNCE